MLVCHPGAPHGGLLPPATLLSLQALCARSGTQLLIDECYVDSHAAAAPYGYMGLGGKLQNVLVFHSLSKRAAAPGLRSGFVAGDAQLVAQYAWTNRQLGVSSPGPVCAAAAKLWEDATQVQSLNARIGEAWRLATEYLADWPGFRAAECGFFLWLNVGQDERFAQRAWGQTGLKVMPGSYLAETVSGHNPGRGHVRIALVHAPAVMRTAFSRLAGLRPAP
jgi:aspartate/methionine/tyrosine aminotransferase